MAGANAVGNATQPLTGPVTGYLPGAPTTPDKSSGRYSDTPVAQVTDAIRNFVKDQVVDTVKDAAGNVPVVGTVLKVVDGADKVQQVVDAGAKHYDERNAISNENQKQMERQLQENREQSGLSDLRRSMED
jgi:hypothetical protein